MSMNWAAIGAIFGALLVMVIGLVLAGTVISVAVTAGTVTGIGSFTGAQSLNNLMPLLYYFILIALSVSGMAIGGAGLAGKGPLSR